MKRIFQHPPERPNPTGRKYWRSVGELNDTPEFRGWLEREFPAGAAEMEGDGLSRRNFLQLMGASLALAGFGLSGCRRPEAYLVPYTKAVEWEIPGKNVFFATTMPRRRGGMPLVAATTEGRPIKLEGNRLHPLSNGSTDPYAQCALLDLYDPDRSQHFLHKDNIVDAPEFVAFMKQTRDALKATGGAGAAILVEETFSPTRDRLRAELAKEFPNLMWCLYDPLRHFNEVEATRAAFGNGVKMQPRFDRADVILSLDSDFLYSGRGRRGIHPRFHQPPPRGERGRFDEPPVRRREPLHDHRRHGGPSPALRGQPDRRARRGAGQEDRRRWRVAANSSPRSRRTPPRGSRARTNG